MTGADASRVSFPSRKLTLDLPRSAGWREPLHGFPRGRGKQHAGRVRSIHAHDVMPARNDVRGNGPPRAAAEIENRAARWQRIEQQRQILLFLGLQCRAQRTEVLGDGIVGGGS